MHELLAADCTTIAVPFLTNINGHITKMGVGFLNKPYYITNLTFVGVTNYGLNRSGRCTHKFTQPCVKAKRCLFIMIFTPRVPREVATVRVLYLLDVEHGVGGYPNPENQARSNP